MKSPEKLVKNKQTPLTRVLTPQIWGRDEESAFSANIPRGFGLELRGELPFQERLAVVNDCWIIGDES